MTRFRATRLACLAVLGLAAGVQAVAAAAPAAAAPATAATVTYTITDLGSLGGGVTHGLAINALGQATGDSFLAKQVRVPCPEPQSRNQKCFANLDHAFLWSNGTMTDPGTLGGDNSQGVAINDSGQVVGSSDTRTGTSSFLFSASDRNLTALSATIGALGINDSGQIAGLCNDRPAAPELFACVASSSGTITELVSPCPRLRESPLRMPRSRRDQRQRPGSRLLQGPRRPRGRRGGVTNGTPAVACPFSTDAHPAAFNGNGQVVGTVYTSTGGEDGWLCNNGTLTDLGPSFFPAAINDSGVFVGGPFIDTGTVQNLNNLIPAGSPHQIESATGINDNGQIVANATDTATGQTHALLLTPH